MTLPNCSRFSSTVCASRTWSSGITRSITGRRLPASMCRIVITSYSIHYTKLYEIGFLPGFPYMGDLPPQLVLPRHEDPRVRIPVGAVAIARSMTGIYPVESPGGWHLIGRTPVPMFDVRSASPSLLAPGDAVAFAPIDAAAYQEILAASKAGEYRLDCTEEAA